MEYIIYYFHNVTNRFCARIELDPPTQRILLPKTGTSTTIIMRMPTTSSLVLRERARAASAIAAANNDAGGSRFEDCWTPSSGLLVDRHTSSSSSFHDVASETRRRNRVNLFILVRILLQYLDKVDPATSTLAREVSFSYVVVSSVCKTVPSPRATAPEPSRCPYSPHITLHHITHNKRQVLKDCGRKHSTSDSNFPTLADAIRERLRDAVGETHWSSARSIHRRLAINQRRRRMANVMDRRRAERERLGDALRSFRVAGHATLSPSSSASSTAMASRK